ncbi:hypothetical protein DFH27DRAFT_598503 [Peziza echinospora]|nr:hypothetical protein DFH27DRAFT_598503 [Peziza echinospora]
MPADTKAARNAKGRIVQPVAAEYAQNPSHLGDFASAFLMRWGSIEGQNEQSSSPHLLFSRQAKCEQGRTSCVNLGHPEICCPAPPASICQATKNTLTGVFCCSSSDPVNSPCDDTNLNCREGSYGCPAKFNGGCCRFGQSCTTTSCLDDGKGPANKDELADYYKGNGEDTPAGDDNPGLDEGDVRDWINDGERLGDNEPKALDGLRTTFIRVVYTSTVVQQFTTYPITITTSRALISSPTSMSNATSNPTTIIQEGFATETKSKAPSQK